MSSPARAHRERVEARLMGEAAGAGIGPASPPSNGPLASAYELKLAQLGLHLKQLREIQSVEAKIRAKEGMILDYEDHLRGWLDAVLAGERPVQDEIVVTMMIWLIDVGHYAAALDLAEPIISGGLTLPERYQRSTGCLVAEEISIAGVAAYATGGSGSFDRRVLERTAAITGTSDMPDQVRARLNKALGLACLADAEAMAPDADGPAAGKRSLQEAAMGYLTRALSLHSAVGVKKEIERLERALAKSAETSLE